MYNIIEFAPILTRIRSSPIPPVAQRNPWSPPQFCSQRCPRAHLSKFPAPFAGWKVPSKMFVYEQWQILFTWQTSKISQTLTLRLSLISPLLMPGVFGPFWSCLLASMTRGRCSSYIIIPNKMKLNSSLKPKLIVAANVTSLPHSTRNYFVQHSQDVLAELPLSPMARHTCLVSITGIH